MENLYKLNEILDKYTNTNEKFIGDRIISLNEAIQSDTEIDIRYHINPIQYLIKKDKTLAYEICKLFKELRFMYSDRFIELTNNNYEYIFEKFLMINEDLFCIEIFNNNDLEEYDQEFEYFITEDLILLITNDKRYDIIDIIISDADNVNFVLIINNLIENNNYDSFIEILNKYSLDKSDLNKILRVIDIKNFMKYGIVLIEHGAEIKQLNHHVKCAIENNCIDVMRYIFDNSKILDHNIQLYMEAVCEFNNLDAAKLLIEYNLYDEQFLIIEKVNMERSD